MSHTYTYTITCTVGASPTTGTAKGDWGAPKRIDKKGGAGRKFDYSDTINFVFVFLNGSTLNSATLTYTINCPNPNHNCAASPFSLTSSTLTLTPSTLSQTMLSSSNGIWTCVGSITDNASQANTYHLPDPESQLGTGSPP